jgi:hypothetical protein
MASDTIDFKELTIIFLIHVLRGSVLTVPVPADYFQRFVAQEVLISKRMRILQEPNIARLVP